MHVKGASHQKIFFLQHDPTQPFSQAHVFGFLDAGTSPRVSHLFQLQNGGLRRTSHQCSGPHLKGCLGGYASLKRWPVYRETFLPAHLCHGWNGLAESGAQVFPPSLDLLNDAFKLLCVVSICVSVWVAWSENGRTIALAYWPAARSWSRSVLVAGSLKEVVPGRCFSSGSCPSKPKAEYDIMVWQCSHIHSRFAPGSKHKNHAKDAGQLKLSPALWLT